MTTEHKIYLTNEAGEQAKVCMLRVQGDSPRTAINLALQQGYKNFNVIEECDSTEGVSSQRVATYRNGGRV